MDFLCTSVYAICVVLSELSESVYDPISFYSHMTDSSYSFEFDDYFDVLKKD